MKKSKEILHSDSLREVHILLILLKIAGEL
jgi:hypothetical protein